MSIVVVSRNIFAGVAIFGAIIVSGCSNSLITGEKGLLRPEIIKVTVSTDNIPPTVKEVKLETPSCEAPLKRKPSRPVDDRLLPSELRNRPPAVLFSLPPTNAGKEQVFPLPAVTGEPPAQVPSGSH